jgi:hypothetical protein
MMTRAVLLIALVACGSAKKQPPPEAAPLIQTAHVLAERVCGCGEDKDCLHGVRDEWDSQKDQLLGNGGRLSGDDKAKFDAEIQRLKMCGDGAGLTFWDH